MRIESYPFSGTYTGAGTVYDYYYGNVSISASGTLKATITLNASDAVSGSWSYAGSYTYSGVDPDTGERFSDSEKLNATGTVSGTWGDVLFDSSEFDGSGYFSTEYLILGSAQVPVPGYGTYVNVSGSLKAPMKPIIKIDSYTQQPSEGSGDFYITLTRSGTQLSEIQSEVALTGLDGAAISSGSNADYIPVSSMPVVFVKGATSVKVKVTGIVDDTEAEANENFQIFINASGPAPVNASLGFSTADITIIDNDGVDDGGGSGDGGDPGGGDTPPVAVVVKGKNGSDSLTGGGGDDKLYGKGGNDSMVGGDGNDSLYGGAGNDALTGGEGSDSFVFDTKLKSVENIDTITDFVSAEDTIQISKKAFAAYKKSPSGDLSPDDFVSGAGVTAQDSSDHFLYDTATGYLYYDPDGSGTKAAIHFATLTGMPTISASDIEIV